MEIKVEVSTALMMPTTKTQPNSPDRTSKLFYTMLNCEIELKIEEDKPDIRNQDALLLGSTRESYNGILISIDQLNIKQFFLFIFRMQS